MRILLDECVPWPLHKVFFAHELTTAQKRGWGGIKNGDLLRLAESEFSLFITTDQNLRYQQNLSNPLIAILVLSTNNLRRLLAASELRNTTIQSIQPGQFVQLEVP